MRGANLEQSGANVHFNFQKGFTLNALIYMYSYIFDIFHNIVLVVQQGHFLQDKLDTGFDNILCHHQYSHKQYTDLAAMYHHPKYKQITAIYIILVL